MAAISEKMEAYLIRRIRELRSQGWTKHDILQQLNALVSSKQLLINLYENN
jgi:hypothetical protein